jgi:predicted permease
MDIYIKLLEVIFPVFFVIGIGYYLGKKDSNFDTKFITNFAANIGSPGMIFYIITSTGVTFDVFIEFFIYSLILIFAFAIVGIFILLILKKDFIRELPPLILPNTGNMGVPICLFAYGTQGLGIASAITSAVILLHFTLNVFLAKKSFSFEVILKSPSAYAVVIAILYLYLDLKVPKFIENTTFLITYATIFLILMSLGVALTRLKVFSLKTSIILSFVRVIIGPIIGFILISTFNLTGFAAGTLLIQCSMPSAVLTYLVASMYSPKKNVDSIASTIVTSTTISFVSVPIVVFFALKYFN